MKWWEEGTVDDMKEEGELADVRKMMR